MQLDDYLRTTGFTKASLARALGISKPAISKWKEIPEKWVNSLEGLTPPVEIPLEKQEHGWASAPMPFIQSLIDRRGGMEGDTMRDKETDYEIASSAGWKVHEFNMAIERWVEWKKS